MRRRLFVLSFKNEEEEFCFILLYETLVISVVTLMCYHVWCSRMSH